MDPREPTLYVRTGNHRVVERALDALFEHDGFERSAEWPDPDAHKASADSPETAPHRVLWAVTFASGWTLVQARPDLFVSRSAAPARSLLASQLARRLRCDVFHVRALTPSPWSPLQLLEATADGRTAISGFVPESLAHEQAALRAGEARPRDDSRAAFRLLRPPPPLLEALAKERWLRCETLMTVLSGAQSHLVEQAVPWVYQRRSKRRWWWIGARTPIGSAPIQRLPRAGDDAQRDAPTPAHRLRRPSVAPQLIEDAWTPALYLRTTDLAAVEQALDALCAEDHYVRAGAPSDLDSAPHRMMSEPLSTARRRAIWARALSSGWTRLWATPPALLWERLRPGEPRFPSRLAARVGCDVFHISIVDKHGAVVLQEATADGRTYTSGFDPSDPHSGHDGEITEANADAEFHLLQLSPALREAVRGECHGVEAEALLLAFAGAASEMVPSPPWIYELRTA